jgi:hypothetical protein
MRDVPAHSLEDFMYEKTDRIETVAYGIETRFWYAGKEIPDITYISGNQLPADQTMVEDILLRRQIPVSEFVIQSYVRDALFRREENPATVLERLVPPVIQLEEREWKHLSTYISDTYDEFKLFYTIFADQAMGPIRQRVGELHTAVIDLYFRLKKSGADSTALPTHTFIVLSQIQNHAAAVMEDLDTNEAPSADELEAMDSSLDSMIDTYEDIKELIEEAMSTYRRSNLSVVKPMAGKINPWRMIQIGIGGTDVWRRITMPEDFLLVELHEIIQASLNWTNQLTYRFIIDKAVRGVTNTGILDSKLKLTDLCNEGITEVSYEYGNSWTVKVLILPRYNGGEGETLRCVAGACAAPPELMEGPLHFRKDVSALDRGVEKEKQAALAELGPDFRASFFDIEKCTKVLNSVSSAHGNAHKSGTTGFPNISGPAGSITGQTGRC